MYSISAWVIFLHSFIAGFLMIWIGLLLVNIRTRIYKLCIAGLLYAIIATYFRYIVGLTFDISFLMQILFILLILMVYFNLGPIQSFVVAFLGIIVLLAGEAVFTPIVLKLSGISIQEIMNSKILVFFIPLPQIILTLIIIYICSKYDFHLFNFNESREITQGVSRKRRIKIITSLVIIQLSVILVQLAFSVLVINNTYSIFKGISLATMGYISCAIQIVGVISMLFLIINLLELTKKESQYETQSAYIETLDELFTTVRSERHDIINHLQTIYGFNQLGYTSEVQNYLDELLEGSILSNEFIVTGHPALTALIYIKSGVARSNDIEFQVVVEEQIDTLGIPSFELNNILGNLINNALDAAMLLDKDKRIVNINIGTDSNYYIFKVSNHGHIEDDLIQKIKQKGFSGKGGEHLGLGLYICNTLIKKYGGYMDIVNTDNQMIEFSIFFPKDKQKGECDESIGPETGSFAG
ncbi:MAG: sensor histidine kinase [Syntrophomonadaceae bacterium]|jgi:two-component system sensor histidine kinase AgrC